MSYPERVSHPALGLSLKDLAQLNFEDPDINKFECLRLAIEVSKKGDATDSAVLNAADELAVHAFLNGEIDFTDIPRIIEKSLENHSSVQHPNLDQILAADAWAREESKQLITRITQAVKA
jgi:1-deoxy-D-xylulose-5-phosphate reductoisomerase